MPWDEEKFWKVARENEAWRRRHPAKTESELRQAHARSECRARQRRAINTAIWGVIVLLAMADVFIVWAYLRPLLIVPR